MLCFNFGERCPKENKMKPLFPVKNSVAVKFLKTSWRSGDQGKEDTPNPFTGFIPTKDIQLYIIINHSSRTLLMSCCKQ